MVKIQEGINTYELKAEEVKNAVFERIWKKMEKVRADIETILQTK